MGIAVVHSVMVRVVTQILVQSLVLITTHRIVMSVMVDLTAGLSVVLQLMMRVAMRVPPESVSRRCRIGAEYGHSGESQKRDGKVFHNVLPGCREPSLVHGT